MPMDRKEGGEEGGESWLFTHEGKMEGGQTQRFQAFFDLLFEEFSGRIKPFFLCMLNPHHVSGQTFRVMKTASPFFQMRKKKKPLAREKTICNLFSFSFISLLSLSYTQPLSFSSLSHANLKALFFFVPFFSLRIPPFIYSHALAFFSLSFLR